MKDERSEGEEHFNQNDLTLNRRVTIPAASVEHIERL